MLTTTQPRFQLDTSSRKNECDNCGQKKMVMYLNSETKEILSPKVGRCDRENSCGYHYTPRQYFTDNGGKERFPFPAPREIETGNAGPINYLPFDVMEKSVRQYHRASLFPFLVKLFTYDVAEQLCLDYLIGADNAGNTCFWHVDEKDNVTQAYVIPYRKDGHRDKEKVIKAWIDKDGTKQEIKGAYAAGKQILKNYKANLKQCFFGEHLLSFTENNDNPISIVESAKSAVIASIYYPDFIWIATGGKFGTKFTEQNVCKVLKGRKIVMFPDLGAYDAWKAKGLLLANITGCQVHVSDLLEMNASTNDKDAGYDIADYLLRDQDSTGLALIDGNYPAIWDIKCGFESFSLQENE